MSDTSSETPTIPPTPGDTLVFENDRVRVWSMTLGPHAIFDFHQHHHDHVIIWPDAGRVQGQNLGDEEWGISQTAEPGFTMFKTVGSAQPLIPHRVRNLDNCEVTHYIVELLGGSPNKEELAMEFNDRGSFDIAG
ncbi:hypothetical protein ACPUD8_19485 [Brevibacterium sp. FAM 25378]|uniref:hypothetical protein n=1 Tax=unclassified Brevibacterium TaxID=2614124 RepID=UPI001091A2B3|nr:hypothetical protein [Brevibacterium sp. S22]TGD32112.1 hypothetical protein EB835_06525 [Brevibacterium sp. S22]